MKLVVVFTLMCLPAIAFADEKPFYVGTYQSNEKLTLKSMRKTKGIPQKMRDNMEHDYYGKLINELREHSFTTYFVGQKPANPMYVDAKFNVTGKKVTIKYYHAKLKTEVAREITFDGDCYWINVQDWHYKEYFCRVDDKPTTAKPSP